MFGVIAVRLCLYVFAQFECRRRPTGIGIEPDNLERIFEAFEQGGKRREGLGLGLAISKAIIEMHRGYIRAFSEGPGKGARFVIDLETAA